MPKRGFYSDEELLGQIQATLALTEVNDLWRAIAPAANRAAAADISRALLARGYSPSQITAWDDGAAYQADQALFWALVRGNATKDVDAELIKELDRRKDLETVTVIVGGEIVSPATSATGVGTMSDAGALFSLADDDLQSWYAAGEGPAVPPYPRP